VADLLDDAQVVGDEEHRQPHLLLQLHQQVDDLGLDGDVERAHGLVAYQQPGAQDKRPGYPDALALAARELVGVAVDLVGQQPDPLHHRLDHPRPVPSRQLRPQRHERLGDDLPDRHARVERRQRVLEHDLHHLAPLAQLPGVQPGQLLAVESHAARPQGRQSQNAPGEAGLSATGFADDAEGLPPGQGETDVLHRLQGLPAAAETPLGGDPELDPQPRHFEKVLRTHGGVSRWQTAN